MIKTALVVPVRDNDGRSFSPRVWRELEARLLRFGGYTIEVGVAGAWESGGRLYRDRSRRYTVALPSWFDVPAWLDVVVWARTRFRQEALYIEIAGIPEIADGS
ncbi:MAG: hypothetical protein ACRDJE_07905 [Dehalococcoidia bacterium]